MAGSLVDSVDSAEVATFYIHDPIHIMPVFIFAISLFIITGNIIVIIVVTKTATLRGPTGYFMISLACADLGVGSLVTPFAVLPSYQHKWPYSDTWCRFSGCVNTLFCSVSIYSLALISIDRYISISRPLRYHSIMTNQTCFSMIAVKWLFLSVLNFLPLVGIVDIIYFDDLMVCLAAWNANLTFAAIHGALILGPPTLSIGFCYVAIFRICYMQSKRIQTEISNVEVSRYAKQKKAVYTLLVIVGAFLIAWVPFLCLEIEEIVISISTNPHPAWLHFATMWLAFSNSFWNSIIYSVLNRKFRYGLLKLFCRKRTLARDAVSATIGPNANRRPGGNGGTGGVETVDKLQMVRGVSPDGERVLPPHTPADLPQIITP